MNLAVLRLYGLVEGRTELFAEPFDVADLMSELAHLVADATVGGRDNRGLLLRVRARQGCSERFRAVL